ncbi:hypothetical protein ESCAB7627_3588 [Escherichia albertii TW07627]|uniref:Uncharacterized protein n=1 Tax=Escherichia albertii (strain TW07627) TaxID=502347 RepID=A0ABC9NLL6_ESCAT|nr:hypothetical protein ESCAB7627_3588 [Escherichia albertii TW07627]
MLPKFIVIFFIIFQAETFIKNLCSYSLCFYILQNIHLMLLIPQDNTQYEIKQLFVYIKITKSRT